MANLEGILERLVKHEVECVLVGGYAAMVHGVSLVTKDINVCTHFSGKNLERIHHAVADLHPYFFPPAPKRPFTLPPNFEVGLQNLYLDTDLGRLDCLGQVLGIGDYAAARAESIPLNLPFGCLWILSRKAMIRAKSALDRPHDKVSVMQLLAIEERNTPEPR